MDIFAVKESPVASEKIGGRILGIAAYAAAAAVAVIVIYYAVSFLGSLQKPIYKTLDAVPENAFLFIDIRNPGEVWEKLEERSALWNELGQVTEADRFRTMAAGMDSLLAGNLTGELLKSSQLTLAFSNHGTERTEILLITDLNRNADISEIDHFVTQVYDEKSIILRTEYKREQISYVNIPAFADPLKYTVAGNLVIASFSEAAIQGCIDRLGKANPLPEDPALQKVQATAGKNVDANIYFQFGRSESFFNRLFSGDCRSKTAGAGNFASWSELDLIIKNDELLLNGYTSTSDTSVKYLDVFRHEPQKSELTSILPYDVAILTILSVGEIEKYLDEYRLYLNATGGLAGYNSRMDEYRSVHGIDLENRIVPLIASEVALAVTEHQGTESRKNTAGIIRLRDTDKAASILADISQSDFELDSPELKDYDYHIRKLPEGNLMESLFGSAFAPVTGNYFIILKDYLVLANDPLFLIHLVNAFYNQKTMEDNYNFQAFSDNLSDRSNLMLYCNIRKSASAVAACFNDRLERLINRNLSVTENFEGMAAQCTYINNMFFTNIYLKYNPEYREVNPSNWEVETDAPVSGEPHLIRDHRTGKLKVIVFDELNTMYMIDHEGRIKWKIPLMQQPVSDVFMVDAYKNRKTQYLFNTTDYLYLIDLNGNYVGDFPVKLAVSATNGIAVLDYDKLKDYRLLFAGEDNRIYNYGIDGKQVDGWAKPHVNHKVTDPIEYLADAGKDYLIATDETGMVYVFNRRGETRITPSGSPEKAAHSKFSINKTNSKGLLLSTNRQGKLFYLDTDGTVSETDFGSFTSRHGFLYADFDNDNDFDFVFRDTNRLVVYDRMKNVLLEQTFPERLMEFTGLFEIPGKGAVIGVVSEESGKVYLFGKAGEFEPLSYISGKTFFTAGSLNNDEHINLIICEGNKVYNYLLN